MRLILTLLASNKWPCNAIDIKSAFLQGKQIERPVFLIHPHQNFRNKIQYGNSKPVFRQNSFDGILMTHVDDFCWEGTENFRDRIIRPLKNIIFIGTQLEQSFRYLGLNISQQISTSHEIKSSSSIKLNQQKYCERE